MTPQVIRSATFEGMADGDGFPTRDYLSYYAMLARYVPTIVTGFLYTSRSGRAMHPGQGGLERPEQAAAFRPVTQAVEERGAAIIAQIAHVGRQTIRRDAVGVSPRRSPYFGVRPRVLSTAEVDGVVEEFARAAFHAREAGFHGVQLHCAHGYLIHQFLLSSVNRRRDEYGRPTLFLERVVEAVRGRCGPSFPIWVKISGEVDVEPPSREGFLQLVHTLDELGVDAIEVSRGTMDVAMNIFRGKVPVKTALKHNPVYSPLRSPLKFLTLPSALSKIKGFAPCYNLAYARLAQEHTSVPVYCVGGFRSGKDIAEADFPRISLCRPFICEPDFLQKLERDPCYHSKCINCNICAVMVDSIHPLRCYRGKQV